MFGSKCSHAGCTVAEDFLPFKCIKCDGIFCTAHRSRFLHFCEKAPKQAPNDEGEISDPLSLKLSVPEGSIKSLFSAVESRHSELSEKGSSTEHLRVKDTRISENSIDEHTLEKIGKLESLSGKSTSSITQKSISKKTKILLMKRKAVGNSTLDFADRLYLHIVSNNYDSSENESDFIFIARKMTISEALREVQLLLPTKFGNDVKDTLLVISTLDTPNWKDWDRDAPVTESLVEFEEVYLQRLSADEVLECQTQRQERRHEQQQQEISSSAISGCDSTTYAPLFEKHEQIKKGSVVWYKYFQSENEKSSLIQVRVVGVHLDDFPNVYYSIQPLVKGIFEEKQTDSNRLLPLSAYSPVENRTEECPVRGRPMNLTIMFNGKPIVVNLGTENTMLELRTLAASTTGASPNSIKLVYKGKVLKHDPSSLAQTLQKGNISLGAKLLLLAGSS